MATLLKQVEPDLGSSIQLVTPEMARRWRETAHFERQRKIDTCNIDRLAREMSSGRFTPGTQIYFCVLPNGSRVLVNGNHTLEAISACGKPQCLTVTHKAVTDLDEAGRIYAVFDIQKVRSWNDSLRAVGGFEELPNASRFLAAITAIENKFGHYPQASSRASRVLRIEHLEEYRETAEIFNQAIHGAPREIVRMLFRAGCLAVALETIRYQPSLAAQFWYDVARDNGLVSGQPAKALLQWMRNARLASGSCGQRDTARAAALAWNAAFRDEQRTYVKPNAMGAFFLLGTPWAKGLGE